MMLYEVAQPVLFRLDPERAHSVSVTALNAANRLGLLRSYAPEVAPVKLLGLTFPNRLGLGAGFDKTGHCIDVMLALGFGFVEVGTVTPRPQPGNPRPRIFRLKPARAVINRMGFPNEGVDALVTRLGHRRAPGVCGINIGKNADTPLEQAADDYVRCLEGVYDHADYLVVNISSPNTKGLRTLQEPEQLRPVLRSLHEARARRIDRTGRIVPILVKIAPDLSDDQLTSLAQLFIELKVEGVIATNTTLSREGLPHGCPNANETGGLSGRPLHERSVAIVRRMRQLLGPDVALMGVGGIESAADALAMRTAGADLVQIYTGFIYRGPALIRQIVQALADFDRGMP